MDASRRRALHHLLLGPGLVGLRALACGLPASLLLAADRGSREGFLRAAKAASTAQRTPQYTLFCTSIMGDPVNANAPGTYQDNTVVHATDPAMAKTSFALGDTQVQAAQIWSTLPAAMRAQMCFFHHATYTVVHPDQGKVLAVQGKTVNGELLPSLIAKSVAPKLGTIRAQPINFNPAVYGAITADNVLQPALTPGSLASMLQAPQYGLQDQNLVALRDHTLDSVNGWIKAQGKAFQGNFIDQYALSQSQVRTMQARVVKLLQGISGNGPAAQIAAAMVLFKLNVAPAVVMTLNFGSDNHLDVNLAGEVSAHKQAIASMATIPTAIDQAGLTGKVSFGMLNVFGRTLTDINGRDHNDKHAVSLIIGSNTRGSVVGGLTPPTDGYHHVARAIDSTTGAADPSGDITYDDTFASYGKTLAACCGMDDAAVEGAFRSGAGKVVQGTLAS